MLAFPPRGLSLIHISVAYLIRGAVIALREEDSDQILVETVGLHRGTEGLKS